MDQIRKLFAALTISQRISIAGAAALVIALLMAFAHWRKESDFKPLYSALGPEDAAGVIAKLKESGTEYRVSENGTAVLAPSARVAELRLELAAAGIPKTGRIGYELFDKTNFGATEFTEHLNFHRALEGEIERSIGTLSSVDAARVHLTFPKDSVFLDSRQPAKASVILRVRTGSVLTAQNVAAITNLVASAVEGLAPEAVSVLDARGNLLNRPHHDLNGDQSSEATLEYRQKIENDLLAKVNATLEPLLGPEKFKAGVSVDCDFTTGEQSEETVDPTKSVMLSSQKSEEQSGSNLASGQPGTASTLPRPTSRPGSGSSGITRRTENMTFQSSRVVRRVTIPQGTVKRMSISVLVDHTVRFEGQGSKARRVVTPPSAETLKAIHDLVAGATGFSTERGDQLVIEALPFETTVNYQPEPMAPSGRTVDPRVPQWLRPYFQDVTTLLIAGAVGAAVVLLVLVALLFLVRGKKAAATAADAIAAAPGTKAISSGDIKEQIAAQVAEQEALQLAMQQQKEAELLNSLKIPVATTKKAEVLIKRLQTNVTKDVEGTANVLRTLLNEADRSTK